MSTLTVQSLSVILRVIIAFVNELFDGDYLIGQIATACHVYELLLH